MWSLLTFMGLTHRPQLRAIFKQHVFPKFRQMQNKNYKSYIRIKFGRAV